MAKGAAMWPATRLSALLGVEIPIVQAPMAGSTTPELAAAVCNAGGLGSLGCAKMRPEDIAGVIAEMRRRTNGAFNLNFFAYGPLEASEADIAAARDAVAPLYAAAGLGAPPAEIRSAVPAAFGPDKLEALLAAPPPVVSFHFGLPDGDAVSRLRAADCRILCTATTVAEARALEAAGVDAIIAQGWEAGGHRGAFAIEPSDAGVGLVALVPQVVDAVGVPVIAAGGIADGRGVAAALALGADGVQIGTAFLGCRESAASALHRRLLREASDTSTRLTRAHSGRPARAHRTAYIDAMADRPTLPYPLMYALSDPIEAANQDPHSPEGRMMLYGQSAGLGRAMPAAELLRTLADETGRRLAALAGGG